MATTTNIYDPDGALLKRGIGNFEKGFIGERNYLLTIKRIKNGYLTSVPMQGETAYLTLDDLCKHIREFFGEKIKEAK